LHLLNKQLHLLFSRNYRPQPLQAYPARTRQAGLAAEASSIREP
jgi:hypothetical protein